ncbi:N-acetylmuramoyl-L-alanine amidase [Bradyrhizobium sp. BRP23]|uniref:amidase n=1 Tax=Bradyrhizobium sp. BRP23 TaxID=2793820 RepID=UPI001CD4B7CF|nr:N-acetylmuramoyl-L-alanine amidase [Bradyrhizobium sp. BRP23]MCA1381309.1 amidase [Bradyrhizobium sp. BRP05]MCA1422434.1 amidase [Bradyrhizobium sp. BRP23]
MASIPLVGTCFPTSKAFLDYLDTIQFKAWTPRFVTMHHTGGPSLATWRSYGNRKVPITDEKWMRNLAGWYGTPESSGGPKDGPWSAGPHFFFTPANFCVLSLPEKRGVHAVSFNALSWGVECVGDFDSEAFTPDLANRYAEGLACLHVALGISPDPFVINVRGLHFHRDDPKTTKTCPGRKVDKVAMVSLIKAHMARLTGSASHDDDDPPPAVVAVKQKGIVNVAAGDFLSVRDEPSAKSPETRRLARGEVIEIIGEAMNGGTRWLKIASDDGGDFVSARYVTLV